MKTQCLENVPADKVPTVVQEFIESGASKITAEKHPDGAWKVCADMDY